MNRHIVRTILGYLSVLVTTVSVAAGAPDLTALRRELNAGGFVVQEGRFGFLDIEKCRESPTCAGNNPSSPYGFLYLPPAPREVRERPCDLLGSIAGSPSLCANFRLRPDEAVLLLGTTPGESKYFSLGGYLYSRYDAKSRGMKTLFASLGDALNQLKMATTGTPGGAAGNPFGQKTAIISTADRGIDLAVRRALEKAGFARSIMNTLPIPSTRPLRMGVQGGADEFGFLFRAAEFSREADRQRFLESPDMVVIRLIPVGILPDALDPGLVGGASRARRLHDQFLDTQLLADILRDEHDPQAGPGVLALGDELGHDGLDRVHRDRESHSSTRSGS